MAFQSATSSPRELLAHARENSSTDPVALASWIYGSNEAVARRAEITSIIERDPKLNAIEDRIFLNHTERYFASVEKCAHFHLKCEQEGWKDPQDVRWAYDAVNDILPTDVHMSMFIPALKYQTSDEQREKWLPLAESFQILGAYVQTELGHGSNVRALETTATFDMKTQSFIIHSPTVSSTKWWPGGLGKTATHCVLYARLLLPKTSGAKGIRDLGVHAFFVQLRDLETHQPLPGVTIGDIGPKLGFNSIDNGFARFDHVSIPRENLLEGVARVDPDGSYNRVPGGEKRMYGAMLNVRANLIIHAANYLARALTITVRFSIARAQGYAPGTDREEISVIYHLTQKAGIIPWMAFCYGLVFTGRRFKRHYESYLSDRPTVPLAVLHAESSGLKAFVTQHVADGIEALRKLCGGHGYSSLSGMPELLINYLALCTLEGTQQVLEPQTTRLIVKALTKNNHKLADLAAPYLFRDRREANVLASQGHTLTHSPQLQLILLGEYARHCARQVAQNMHDGILIGKLTRAHSRYILLKDMVEGVDGLVTDGSLGDAELRTMEDLARVLGVTFIDNIAGELAAARLVTPAELADCQEAFREFVHNLCPELVSLVDAWSFTDSQLGNSAIGSDDGDIYNQLFDYAQKEPLNSTPLEDQPHLEQIRRLTQRKGNGMSKL